MLECGSIKTDVKNCSAASACAALLNALQYTHTLWLLVPHMCVKQRVLEKKTTTDWTYIMNSLWTSVNLHRASRCVQTHKCHGSTETSRHRKASSGVCVADVLHQRLLILVNTHHTYDTTSAQTKHRAF